MFKKIFIGISILFVLLIGALAAIPFLFKDEINALIKEQINKEVLADVDYTSYDLSILRSFPDLYFTLDNLTIVGRDDFAGDTLANVKEIGLGLELMKFIRGEQLQINSVLIDEAKILAYSYVTEAGDTIANYDILPPSESVEESSTLIDINVDDFEIRNSNIYFADANLGIEVLLKGINSNTEFKYVGDLIEVQTDLTMMEGDYQDLISGMHLFFEDFTTSSSINYSTESADIVGQMAMNSLSFNDGSSLLLNQAKVVADLNIAADLVNNIYTLTETDIAINALKLYADGSVALPDDHTTRIDLKFNADRSSFKDLLSLIPASYMKDYEGLNASGNFSLNGFAKGDLTETKTPAFDVNLAIENGNVQYPELPSAIENINLKANFNNSSSNIENTNISIPNASLSVVGEPIIFSLMAQNALGDPFIDLKVKGKLDLNRVPEFYPIEGLTEIGGLMDADVSFKGLLSAVEEERYQDVDFGGALLVNDFKYNADDLASPLAIKTLTLNFSPEVADMQAQGVVLGKSDFNIDGHLENIINYVMSDGTVKGDMLITSNYLDLDELLGAESSETETENSTATKVPANIDFVGKLRANEVMYDGLSMKQVDGTLSIQNEQLDLKALNADLLGGKAVIDASYSTKGTDKPEVAFSYDIQKFDIQETFKYLNTVQAIAPLAKYLTGSFSTNMSLSSFLNNDLSLDLSMLNGLGKVAIPYATFNDLPMLNKISETLKLPAFDKPALNNAWTVLKFEDGKVNVEPFELKMKDLVMNIEGSNSFDQTIDYQVKLSVPSDKFGGAAGLANDFLSKQKIPLLNLSVPQNLNFHLNVSGAMASPSVKIVKVTAGESDKGVKDQIKDEVKEQFNQAKEDLNNKAKEEADKAKAQAQEEIDKAKAKAQEEADKAKQKAQEEIDKAKEDLKEGVKDKIKGFKW